MKLFTNSMDENTKLGILERGAYGTGNMANGLIYAAISAFLVYYYTNAVGLAAGTIGFIMLISRIFDGITDLVMGQLVDRLNTPFGKTRGWILFMCVPYAICSILTFSVPANWSETLKYIYVFISYNLTFSFLYTALAVPYNTLASMLTRDPMEHGLLGIFSMLFSMISAVFVNMTALGLIQRFGGDARAWTITITIYAVIGIILHLICFFGTHERTGVTSGDGESKSDGVPFTVGMKALFQNKYWLICVVVITVVWLCVSVAGSALVYYTDAVLGNAEIYASLSSVGNIFQLAGLFASALLVAKLGKVNTFRFGIALMLLAVVIMVFVSTNINGLMVCRVINGIGSGFASACLAGLALDTIDYGEWKTGIRVASLNLAAVSFAQKVGTGLASGVLGAILSLGGYDADPTSTSAIFAIKFCNIYLPIILLALILILMIPYHLDKEFPEILEDLKRKQTSNQ